MRIVALRPHHRKTGRDAAGFVFLQEEKKRFVFLQKKKKVLCFCKKKKLVFLQNKKRL